MLRRNIEAISPDHLDIIITALDGDGDGQQIAAVWIAKEQLRALLALRATRTRVTPAPSQVRDKLASFYLWCADHADVPEIKTLAKTIEKWQQPVIDAVLTGYSNAKAEAHNRTAKWSHAPPADSLTRVTRPAASAWRPPAAPASAPAGRPAGRHGTLPGLRSMQSLPATVTPDLADPAACETPVKYGDPTSRAVE